MAQIKLNTSMLTNQQQLVPRILEEICAFNEISKTQIFADTSQSTALENAIVTLIFDTENGNDPNKL